VSENPLGKVLKYPQTYAPELLYAIPRAASRASFISTPALPFHGTDVWNAWELCWLDTAGKPEIAKAVLRIPADSVNLIESKSLKLYLNSHANCRYPGEREIAAIIAADTSSAAGAAVSVTIETSPGAATGVFAVLPGTCIDDADTGPVRETIDGTRLRADAKHPVCETLHSHLLRSNCPVNGQPDTGSVLVRYEGGRLSRRRLLEYVVSYRSHDAFHEDCVERMFVDLKTYAAPEKLTVYARFARRGGLDINPFRSDFEESAENLRLWRQ
jgi:7-cyano-7-deazaguanine reductase